MDVLLYVADTLRADHLSCYGYHRGTTPHIDDIAEEGIRFSNCFSPSTWTRPAAVSLLSGLYPPAHRTETRRETVPRELELLSHRFQKVGFRTACVTAMGNVSTATGFGRGFGDIFEVYKDEDVIERRKRTTASDEKLYYDGQELLAYPRAEDLNTVLFNWWEDHDDADTFVLVWAIDPHMPYDPPPEADWFLEDTYDGDPELGRKPDTLKNASGQREFQRLQNLYDCCVRYMDERVGEIRQWLRDAGRDGESILCFVGDHGESFGERTLIRNPIRGHSTAPYDEQIHVPFVLQTPERRAETDEELRSLIDVAPTLLDAVGLDPFEAPVQGVSALDSNSGRDSVFARTKVGEESECYYGVRTTTEKYINIEPPALSIGGLRRHLKRHVGLRMFTDLEQLYDLDEDPVEQENLNAQAPGRREQYGRQVLSWVRRCEETDIRGSGTLSDPVTIEQLEALGYK